MKNTHTISTNKIIVFIVFICAAIMTSLFVFHLRQKAEQAVLSPDIGMMFPVARDIKSFELMTADNQPFKHKDFYHHWTLLFFGFTHCADVCPATLDLLNRVYTQLQNKVPHLQVVLISLDPERDTPESLSRYTHSFNPHFIGVTGSIQELRKLQSQLGIFSVRDDTSKSTNYQLQHTSSIMLINPQGKWAGFFKYGLKPDQFAQGVEKSVNSL